MIQPALGAIAERLAEAYRVAGELLEESTDPRAARLMDLIFDAAADMSLYAPEQIRPVTQDMLGPANEPDP